jgi:hypothetical protein
MNDTAPQISNERQRFTASYETRLLYERLRKLEVKEIVSYQELSKIIGQDVQESGRGALTSARKMAQRDDRIVTDAVTNVGITRIGDVETIASASLTFKKVRRAVQRGTERLTSVDFDNLSNDDKIRHNASISAFMVMKMMGRPKTVERLAAAVNTTNTGQLPIARTLELFRGPKQV